MEPLPRPSLRGVSHQIACPLAIAAGAVLVALAPSARAALASAVFAASMALLFGVSALYHRRTWEPAARASMRRLDHSMIFVLIAGSYTPICLLAMRPEEGLRLLALVWGIAALGMGMTLVWLNAPRLVLVLFYVAMGWVSVGWFGIFARTLGAGGLGLLLASGAAYTTGAVIYALKRPNPAPRTFGYHEIFHALVIMGAGFHWALVRSILDLRVR